MEEAIGDTSIMKLKKDSEDESLKLGFDKLLERYRPNKKQSNELKKNLINNSLSDESLTNLIKKKLKNKENDFGSGALWKFSQIVGSARYGAVTHPGAKQDKRNFSDI